MGVTELGNPGPDADRQRQRLEGARFRHGQQLVEALAGCGEHRSGRLGMDPPGHAQGLFVRAELHEGFAAAPRVADDLPGVAGGGRRVDDQAPGGALAQRLFVLEGPAAVVGERRSAEESRIVGCRLVREEDDDLALDIDPLVVIPLELGGDDAVTDIDGFSVHLGERLLPVVHSDEIVEVAQAPGARSRRPAQHGIGLCPDTDKRNRPGSTSRHLPLEQPRPSRTAPRCTRWRAPRHVLRCRVLRGRRSTETGCGRRCGRRGSSRRPPMKQPLSHHSPTPPEGRPKRRCRRLDRPIFAKNRGSRKQRSHAYLSQCPLFYQVLT